jgi:transcription elongation factor GreA
VKELEGILAAADVIDTSRLSGAVKFGARVTLIDEDTEEEKTFQLVGEPEADLERGLLNVKSPLARALIGKDEGDTVEVRTPGGEKSYEIIRVQFG